MSDALRAVLAYTDNHSGTNGICATALPGLHLIRGNRATPLQHQFYEPALIAVLQGSKETILGNTRFAYCAGQYLIMSIGLPVQASITKATDAHPYLALAITLDAEILGDLIREVGCDPAAAAASSRLGLFVGSLDARQMDALTRFAGILASPKAFRVLAPSIVRELFYWTLTGPDGAEIARFARSDSHTQHIAAAIHIMRTEYAESFSIEQLARIADMSPSSFHHHFKQMTSMSPLQYQKQLRLLEARRLMLVSGADATRAAYQVGYESASQFSREYARFFGAPPRRDIAAYRAAAP